MANRQTSRIYRSVIIARHSDLLSFTFQYVAILNRHPFLLSLCNSMCFAVRYSSVFLVSNKALIHSFVNRNDRPTTSSVDRSRSTESLAHRELFSWAFDFILLVPLSTRLDDSLSARISMTSERVFCSPLSLSRFLAAHGRSPVAYAPASNTDTYCLPVRSGVFLCFVVFRQHTRWYGEASNERNPDFFLSLSLPLFFFSCIDSTFADIMLGHARANSSMPHPSRMHTRVLPSRFDFRVRMSHHSHPSLSCFFLEVFPPPRFSLSLYPCDGTYISSFFLAPASEER